MTNRRGFLGTVATLGTGAALGVAPELHTVSPASDAWLEALKGKHRQLLDAPDPEGGTVLRHVRT